MKIEEGILGDNFGIKCWKKTMNMYLNHASDRLLTMVSMFIKSNQITCNKAYHSKLLLLLKMLNKTHLNDLLGLPLTKYHKLSGLKQQKQLSILSRFRSPEVWNQGVGRVSSFLAGELRGTTCSTLLACGSITPTSASMPPSSAFSLYVSVSLPKVPSSYRDLHHTGFRAHPYPARPHLNCTLISAKSLFPNRTELTDSGG